jgi:hypothetical protein
VRTVIPAGCYTKVAFAKACNISRWSLYDFEKRGFLKPHLVPETGFPYYTAEQLEAFQGGPLGRRAERRIAHAMRRLANSY